MRKIILIFLLFLGLVTPVSAGVVAYDGLNAPDGNINGVASGWNFKPWEAQNPALAGYRVAAPGLSFGSLQVTGSKVIGGDSWTSAGRLIGMPATWEPDNEWVPWRKQDGDGRYKAGAEGTTLWASFLARQDLSNNDYGVFFAQSHIGWNMGAEGAKVGLSAGVWTLSEIGGGPSASTGVARTVGQTYLMVLEIEFLTEGSDRVTLFVNPTPGLGAPSVAGTSITTTKDFCLYNVAFYPSSGQNGGAMDELRFGSTFADVTPVPEPATIGLLVLGCASVLRKRRR